MKRRLLLVSALSLAKPSASFSPSLVTTHHNLTFGPSLPQNGRFPCKIALSLKKSPLTLAKLQGIHWHNSTVQKWLVHGWRPLLPEILQTVSWAAEISVEIIVPRSRIAGRQTHRSNPSSSSVEEHYRRAVMIPLLDHVIFQLDERFGDIHQTVVRLLNLVPTNLISDRGDSRWWVLVTQSMPSALQELAKLYTSDLPVENRVQQLMAAALAFA